MPEPVTVLTIGGAVAAVKKIDEGLGLIAKVLDKLRAKPDIAAQKLAEALDEVAKTYQVLDGAISSYLSLGIDAGALEKNSKLLLDIEGGRLAADVERGRGHCHVIGNIYSQYLDKWLARVLKADEYQSLQRVFDDLGNADADVFADLTKVAGTLEGEAGKVLDLVTKGGLDQARQYVLEARNVLKPLRLAIAKTMRGLYELKTAFVEISGAV
jgi:hypothetical protein